MRKSHSFQKGNVLVLVLLLVLIISAVFAYVYSNKAKQREETPEKESTSVVDKNKPTQKTPEEKKDLVIENGWKTFTSSYGFEFKYPAKLDLDEQKIAGETGFAYCIDFSKAVSWNFLVRKVFAGGAGCYSKDFGAGGTSKDFEAGRSGGFLDAQGYTFSNNVVTIKFSQKYSKSFEIPRNLIKEVSTNKNGVEIVKIIGKNEDNGSPFPVTGTPGENYLGAIINLPDSNLTGIGFQYSEETKLLTEEEFNQILDTIKYTK